MGGAKATYLPDVLEEHVEELEFLWGRWNEALRSPEQTAREVRELIERIEAHEAGVLAVGAPAVPLLWEKLGETDPHAVCAAARLLLRTGRREDGQAVIEALRKAEGEPLEGFRMALTHVDVRAYRTELDGIASSNPASVAIVAVEALARGGDFVVADRRSREFVAHHDPSVRAAGWRIVALRARKMPESEA